MDGHTDRQTVLTPKNLHSSSHPNICFCFTASGMTPGPKSEGSCCSGHTNCLKMNEDNPAFSRLFFNRHPPQVARLSYLQWGPAWCTLLYKHVSQLITMNCTFFPKHYTTLHMQLSCVNGFATQNRRGNCHNSLAIVIAPIEQLYLNQYGWVFGLLRISVARVNVP